MTAARGGPVGDGGSAWRKSLAVVNDVWLGLGLHFIELAFRPPRQLLAFRPARRAEPERLHDERMVEVLFPLFVGPIVGSNVRLDDELIALAHVLRDYLSETVERHEPQSRDDLTRVALLVLACVVIAYQAKLGVCGVALHGELGIFREVADRGHIEAVH